MTSMLLHRHGNQLLRVKGILNVADAATPVAVHAVQHLVHPPRHLAPGDEVGAGALGVAGRGEWAGNTGESTWRLSRSGSCTQALPYPIAAAYLLRITQSGGASTANISAAVPSKRPFIFAKIRWHVAISGVSLKSSNFSEPPITTASRRGKTYP
jgi:hypothetical protein